MMDLAEINRNGAYQTRKVQQQISHNATQRHN